MRKLGGAETHPRNGNVIKWIAVKGCSLMQLVIDKPPHYNRIKSTSQ